MGQELASTPGGGLAPSILPSDALNILMKHGGCISSGHHVQHPGSRKGCRLQKGTCFLRTLLEGTSGRCHLTHLQRQVTTPSYKERHFLLQVAMRSF